jgi:hypothetical protein
VIYSIIVFHSDAADCLVGLHVLQHWLTGNRYQNFFLHDLPKLLEDVPLAVTE